jgi:SNF2 family DNA or RNA helicase
VGYAVASMAEGDERIEVRTYKERGIDDFAFMLAACKRVPGAHFINRRRTGDRFWAYPASVEVCHALRKELGERLDVDDSLADWYVRNAELRDEQVELSYTEDAELQRVPAKFANWLRGYQRAGALWIAQGYRGGGLVADMPGLGKTPETLAALLEADVRGPVLVVCPKSSVKSVWGREARQHLRGVPVYVCTGDRAQRMRMLGRFTDHVTKDPDRLRIVVVVAEMLRVVLGDPCYTWEWERGGEEDKVIYKNKISGMCKQRFKSMDGVCRLHVQKPAERPKDKVPVDFTYPNLFDTHSLRGGWSWVVLDESHKLLGSLTVTKANLMGRALKLLPEREGRQRRALSGTPFGKGGKLQGMFGTLHWLWPDEYTSYWKWIKAHFETDEKVIGYDRSTHSQKTAMDVLGPKGMPVGASPTQQSEYWENFMRTLGPRVLRRTKEEMLKDLPPKTYVEVLCEMDPRQAKQYKDLLEWAEIMTPGGPVIANGSLALLTRSQQLANGALLQTPSEKPVFTQDSGKLDRLWEMLDARGIIDGAPGPKLVVATRYTEFLKAIAEMLAKEKVKYLRLDGSVSDSQRQVIMAMWQQNKNPARVLLINTKAAGISINLDAADEMHMMDEDPDPGVNEQVEDRIHRASRNHKVIIYYYRTEGTLDYAAAHNVEFRRQLQHALLDGRRGMAYARELLKEAGKLKWNSSSEWS